MPQRNQIPPWNTYLAQQGTRQHISQPLHHQLTPQTQQINPANTYFPNQWNQTRNYHYQCNQPLYPPSHTHGSLLPHVQFANTTGLPNFTTQYPIVTPPPQYQPYNRYVPTSTGYHTQQVDAHTTDPLPNWQSERHSTTQRTAIGYQLPTTTRNPQPLTNQTAQLSRFHPNTDISHTRNNKPSIPPRTRHQVPELKQSSPKYHPYPNQSAPKSRIAPTEQRGHNVKTQQKKYETKTPRPENILTTEKSIHSRPSGITAPPTERKSTTKRQDNQDPKSTQESSNPKKKPIKRQFQPLSPLQRLTLHPLKKSRFETCQTANHPLVGPQHRKTKQDHTQTPMGQQKVLTTKQQCTSNSNDSFKPHTESIFATEKTKTTTTENKKKIAEEMQKYFTDQVTRNRMYHNPTAQAKPAQRNTTQEEDYRATIHNINQDITGIQSKPHNIRLRPHIKKPVIPRKSIKQASKQSDPNQSKATLNKDQKTQEITNSPKGYQLKKRRKYNTPEEAADAKRQRNREYYKRKREEEQIMQPVIEHDPGNNSSHLKDRQHPQNSKGHDIPQDHSPTEMVINPTIDIQPKKRRKFNSPEEAAEAKRQRNREYYKRKRAADKNLQEQQNDISNINEPEQGTNTKKQRNREHYKRKCNEENFRQAENKRHREKYTSQKEKSDAPQTKDDILITKFHTLVEKGPIYVCLSCNRLLYKHSVMPTVKAKQLSNEAAKKCTTLIKGQMDSEWICQTCYNYIKRKKIPPMAIANGNAFPKKTPKMKLTSLEWRLLAPRIVFMKLHQAPQGDQ